MCNFNSLKIKKVSIITLFIFFGLKTYSQAIVGVYSYGAPMVMEGAVLNIKNNGDYEYGYGRAGLQFDEKGTWKENGDTLELSLNTVVIELESANHSDSSYLIEKNRLRNAVHSTKKFLILKSFKALKKHNCLTIVSFKNKKQYAFCETFSKSGAKRQWEIPKRFVKAENRIYLKILFNVKDGLVI